MNRLKSIILSILYPYACKDCGKRIRWLSEDSSSVFFFGVCKVCWGKMLQSCDAKIKREEEDKIVTQIKRALREHEAEKCGASQPKP